MFCPVCETEYDESFDQCPTCGSQLVPDLTGGAQVAEDISPFRSEANDAGVQEIEESEDGESDVEPIPFSEVPDLVQVYAGAGFGPELIRSVLEGSGIPVHVKGTGMEGVYGGAIEIRILVRQADEQRAREVIASAESGEFEILEED